MIADKFDDRTLANMEVALDRACKDLPGGGSHAARRRIARKILECAREGDVTLAGLTKAGLAAAAAKAVVTPRGLTDRRATAFAGAGDEARQVLPAAAGSSDESDQAAVTSSLVSSSTR